MEVESHEWEDFESFNESNKNEFVNNKTNEEDEPIHNFPRNSACFLLGVASKDEDYPAKQADESTPDVAVNLKNVSADELIENCFSTNQKTSGKCLSIASTFSKILKKGFALIENDKVWKRVVGNFGTLLPIDWQTSRARELQEAGLRLSEKKTNSNNEEEVEAETQEVPFRRPTSAGGRDSPNLDPNDEEEEIQQAFDMHSLILSTNVHQEPLFTAEQVISEIEEMMMEESMDATEDPAGGDPESFVLRPIPKKQNDDIQYEMPPLKKPIIGELNEMTVLELCELYDELECIVREYSECLIRELAQRDELEYSKETKNQFISLFLSLQRKKRNYLSDEKKKKKKSSSSSRSKQQSVDHASKVYLTTTIPYDHTSGPPSPELLDIYVKILRAMDEESANLPMLLTEYILKVVCPT